jgi:hypothetical protein
VEAKFFRKAGTKPEIARREFNEWLAEVEGQIANIRAQRTGEGLELTRRQARALAGEWYDWFYARHSSTDKDWEQVLDQVQDAMRAAVGMKRWEENHPNELWVQEEELRETLRPLLADAGETSQFLATKTITLNNQSRALFLDFLYKDLAAVLKLLIRHSEGDFSPDTYGEKFPKLEDADSGNTPVQLFERWIAERKPAAGSVELWQYVFQRMEEKFKGRSAASISADEAQQWITSLVTRERGAHTVDNTWIGASRTIFGWAKEHNYIPRNPFENVKVTLPKRTKLRETKAFFPHEYRLILKASLGITDTSDPFDAAKRWVPWLLAYTGARPREITQLRKHDVIERDGIPALHFTPEAGSRKSGAAQAVPLHEHLIAQGFLTFVHDHSDGPLFYKPDQKGLQKARASATGP